MAVDIQLAIQGGGAKLSSLLAAMEAVQELQAEKKIRVTRVAGTSAGAIAAALLAAGADFRELRKDLQRKGDKLLRMLPPPSPGRLMKLFWGDAMVDLQPLKKALGAVMDAQKVQRFADLKIPLVVVATDLTNGGAHVYRDPELNVVSAVLDSCALPFYFRGPAKKNDAALLVDGGVCENFPVDVLQQYEKDSGPVVGISFQTQSARTNPTTFVGMAMALLNAAIENSVRRAQRQLGQDRLLLLPGDIGLLDFKTAVTDGLGARYELTTRDTRDFFDSFVRGRAKQSVLVEGEGELDSLSTLQRHADLYEAQHANVRMDYLDVRMLVRAGSLPVPGVASSESVAAVPDMLSYRVKFQAAQEPIRCVRLAVLEEKGFEFQQTRRTQVLDRHFNLRETIDLRARDRLEPDRRAYLLFLNPPIVPGDPAGPFTLDYTHQVTGLLRELAVEGVTTIGFNTQRSAESIPQISLIVVMPSNLRGFRMRASADTSSSEKGRPMRDDELRRISSELSLGADHYVIGWVGTKIEPGCDFAAEVYDPRVESRRGGDAGHA